MPASSRRPRNSPQPETGQLAGHFALDTVHGNEMLDMLDWLGERQTWIEKSLANRHLRGGTLILYDVTSSYVEGKDAGWLVTTETKRGKMQIVLAVRTAIRFEVFPRQPRRPQHSHADQSQDSTSKNSSGRRPRHDHLASARNWIGSRSASCDQTDHETDICSRTRWRKFSAEFPGERLLVCLNPRLRQERAQKRTARHFLAQSPPARRHSAMWLGDRRKVDLRLTDSDLLSRTSSESTTKLNSTVSRSEPRCQPMPSTPTQWLLTNLCPQSSAPFADHPVGGAAHLCLQ